MPFSRFGIDSLALRDAAPMAVDFGRTAVDYGRYRAGFPPRFFKRLFDEAWVRPDGAVLDLGTGTGTVARGLAMRGCQVTGLDSEQHLLTEAARLDREAATGVAYVEGRAEETGLPARSFDVVTAGQCWHWFDRPRAIREVARVLKPGGHLVIAHFDWLPLGGNVVAMTERLVARFNPQWRLGNDTGLYPQFLTDAAEGGFADLETFSFDLDVAYTHEAWRGRIRASAGVGASLPADEVTQFDAALDAALRAGWPAEPLVVPHRIWALKARWPAEVADEAAVDRAATLRR